MIIANHQPSILSRAIAGAVAVVLGLVAVVILVPLAILAVIGIALFLVIVAAMLLVGRARAAVFGSRTAHEGRENVRVIDRSDDPSA